MKGLFFFVMGCCLVLVTGCADDTSDPAPASCTAGVTQCSAEGLLQTCSDAGDWDAGVACAEGESCDDGHEGMDYAHCMAPNHGAGDDHDHEGHGDGDHDDHEGHGDGDHDDHEGHGDGDHDDHDGDDDHDDHEGDDDHDDDDHDDGEGMGDMDEQG